MVKTYKLLSAFVLYVIVGNLVAAGLLMLVNDSSLFFSVNLNVLTVYLIPLWVVLKLLQAHYPDKTLRVELTSAVRRKLRLGLIASLVVCAVMLAADIPGFFNEAYNVGATFETRILWLYEVRLPNVLSPLRSLPMVIVILLVNVYVRLFYWLAGRMAKEKENEKVSNISEEIKG